MPLQYFLIFLAKENNRVEKQSKHCKFIAKYILYFKIIFDVIVFFLAATDEDIYTDNHDFEGSSMSNILNGIYEKLY